MRIKGFVLTKTIITRTKLLEALMNCRHARNLIIFFMLAVGILFCSTLCTGLKIDFENSVKTISKIGSKGEDVKKIQNKLKEKGYYSGSIDGVFGNKTKEAVIRFQRDKGLTQDGIVGSKTLKALGISGQSNQTGKYSDSDVNLLAKIITAESRGEPYSGQVAVGAVILNRVEHPSFPDTIAGVVYQPGAFSCLQDGQINAKTEDSCKQAARDAMNGSDPTGGAIYYYNPAKTSNSFMWSRPVLITIGKHKFCS